MKIYALKFVEIDFSLFNKLMGYISEEKKTKISRFINNKDKYRGLISEILIRNIICEQLNISNDEICFVENKFGKPFLKGYDNLHFNISHSGQWIVCTVDDKDIGVDIEKIEPIDYRELSENFFSDKEYKFILESSLSDQLKNFYRIWTLKESYIKAEGKGLSIPLKSFAIEIGNTGTIQVVSRNSLSKYYFKEFDIDCHYKMSICSLNFSLENEVVIISQNDLITKFMRLVRRGD